MKHTDAAHPESKKKLSLPVQLFLRREWLSAKLSDVHLGAPQAFAKDHRSWVC